MLYYHGYTSSTKCDKLLFRAICVCSVARRPLPRKKKIKRKRENRIKGKRGKERKKDKEDGSQSGEGLYIMPKIMF